MRGGRGVRRRGGVALAGAVLLSASGGPASTEMRSAPGIAVARLAWADGNVERQEPGGERWRRLQEGDAVRTGDRIRTAADGVARIEFPWMAMTAGPATSVLVPAHVVLSTVLEAGRAELEATDRDIVKLRAAGTEVRGIGRVVVRRDAAGRVSVMAMQGRFRVDAEGIAVDLSSGEGTLVRDGARPYPAARLPQAPAAVHPGADPVYVRYGEAVSLTWDPPPDRAHVQVLPFASDEVLLARDVGAPPFTLSIPWVGTFRWRVSARDANGLEGQPSAEGFVCVVER
jgi:hypothetical protein